MNLHDIPFKKIKEGTKTIELRLNDEKRQLLKIKDDDKVFYYTYDEEERLLNDGITYYEYDYNGLANKPVSASISNPDLTVLTGGKWYIKLDKA